MGRDLAGAGLRVALRSWGASGLAPLHCEASRTWAGDAIGVQRSESRLEQVARFRAIHGKRGTAGALGGCGQPLAGAQSQGCGREMGRLLSTRTPFPVSGKRVIFSEILRTSLSLLYSVTGPETVITPAYRLCSFSRWGMGEGEEGQNRELTRPSIVAFLLKDCCWPIENGWLYLL